MQPLVGYSGRHFAFFRILLGLYLAVYFLWLIPYGNEWFGSRGDTSAFLVEKTGFCFFNLLNLGLSPFWMHAFLILLLLLSLSFCLGFIRHIAAVVLWYGWACLLNRNLFLTHSVHPYLGWLLMACAFVPEGEAWSVRKQNAKWFMPSLLFSGAWVLLTAGFFISGVAKLKSPSWIDGNAFKLMLHSPLSSSAMLSSLLKRLPDEVLQGATWFGLGLQLASLPLILWQRTRPFYWLALAIFYFAMILLFGWDELALGMGIFLIFLFDPRWSRKPIPAGIKPVVFFDGVCGLCNRFVDFALSEDAETLFLFAALQGQTAKQRLPENVTPDGAFRSIILEDGEGIHRRSEAVLRIYSYLGGGWGAIERLARLIPRSVRDPIYDWVAAHRYAWFGKRDLCRLPTPEERAKFLD